VTKALFIKIFEEGGIDGEWAEICWNRTTKENKALDEESVRKTARNWERWRREGGF